MKLAPLKIIIASVCFLPFIVLAGGPPMAPDIIEVTVINEGSNIILIASVTTIAIGALTAIGLVKKWKKKP